MPMEPLLEITGRLLPPRDKITDNGTMPFSAKKAAGILIEIALSVITCNW